MILAVDIGNSNIVIGGVDGNDILFEARLRTDATKTSDEYCIDVKMILEVYEVSKQDGEQRVIAENTQKLVLDLAAGDMALVRLQPATDEAFTIAYKLVKE